MAARRVINAYCTVLLRQIVVYSLEPSTPHRLAPKPACVFAFDLHSFHYLFLNFQLTLPLIWYCCDFDTVEINWTHKFYTNITYKFNPPACTVYIMPLHVLFTLYTCMYMYCIHNTTWTHNVHAAADDQKLAFRICVLIGQPRWSQTNPNKPSYGNFQSLHLPNDKFYPMESLDLSSSDLSLSLR